MALDEKKKKISIIALSSILLVAMVCGVTHGVTRKNDQSGPENYSGNAQVSTSAKAIKMESPESPAPGSNRRLLQDGTDGFPSFVDATSRRLLGTTDKPNAIVAQDGSGQFRTISEAVKTIPKYNKDPFIIFVKAGVYKEQVLIQADRVVLKGEGPTKTKITANKSYGDGTDTFHSFTFAVDGSNFIGRDIGIENSSGPAKNMAVALRAIGDGVIFYNCQIDGYQDTLLAHTNRQFFRDCTITGTVDFVFGDGQAVFQNCKFIVKKPLPNQPLCFIIANGRKQKDGHGGFIIQNSQILAAPELRDAVPKVKVYLGRPWKPFSRTIIMDTFIDGFIDPEGWYNDKGYEETSYIAEYQNKGPGSKTDKRVTWKSIQKITPQIAKSFMPGKYFTNGDAWIRDTSIPYDSGV